MDFNNVIPRNWEQFLQLDENTCKKELFSVFAEQVITHETDKEVVSTKGEGVLVNNNNNNNKSDL